jgi:prolyl oligopeptidase
VIYSGSVSSHTEAVFASPNALKNALKSSDVLLDLNTEDPSGTTSLSGRAWSEDGLLFAYATSKSGSDWQTIRVRDVRTKKDLIDAIPWCKFSSISWTHDHKGFFYTRFPAPVATADAGTETAATNDCMLYYHRVGTDSAEDTFIYSDPSNPHWRFSTEISNDGLFLLMTTYMGTDPVNKVYIAELGGLSFPAGTTAGSDGKSPLHFIHLIDNWDAQYSYVFSHGRDFVFQTNLDAPRQRLVRLSLPSASQTSTVAAPTPVEIVPEHAKDVLDWAAVFNNGRSLLLCYMADVTNKLVLHDIAQNSTVTSLLGLVPLPGPGTIVSASCDYHETAAFVKYVSFLSPGTVLRIGEITTGAGTASNTLIAHSAGNDAAATSSALGITEVQSTAVPDFDASEFESSQIFVPSKDGLASLPVFVVQRRQAVASPAPCLLYGYGGFNVSLQPTFSATRLLWLKEFNGVFAMAW